jgi:hypothetical protein
MANNPQDAGHPGRTDQPFNADEHLSLYKFKILTEIKDQILDWAKVRLGIGTAVLSLLILTGAFVGIKLLVAEQIERIAKAPVQDQIKVLQDAGDKAKEKVEALRLQSEHVTAQSFDAQRELTRLKAEADNVRRFVKETETTIQGVDKLAKDVRTDAERFKQGFASSSQHFHEQALKTKADMLMMRNNIQLLESGFGIIEKLAAEIRQKDPQSELARQFAGFGTQWREARAEYEKRAALIRVRRDVKIIHYLRDTASPERQRQSEVLVNMLLAEGYTAEGWSTKPGTSEFDAAREVGAEFGVDPRLLLTPIVVMHPSSDVNADDVVEIAAKAGLKLPAISRQELAPKKSLIALGGDNGGFKPANIILIAELTDK